MSDTPLERLEAALTRQVGPFAAHRLVEEVRHYYEAGADPVEALAMLCARLYDLVEVRQRLTCARSR